MTRTTTRLPKVAIERASLADAAYESLLAAILSGQLSPGAPLNAVALSSQLEVSRTPIQEAIRRLAGDGLVELVPGRVARVCPRSRARLLEIYELRVLLESKAAAEAALRMSLEEARSLRGEIEILLTRQDEIGWVEPALALDERFHAALAAASGNSQLAAEIQRYRLLVRGFCRLAGTVENLAAAHHEHLTVLASVAASDSCGAAAAMAAHIRLRRDVVLKQVYGDSADQESTMEVKVN